jgi:thiamine transport system ATP-binding protein
MGLEVNSLSVRFDGVDVVDDVSFQVPGGTTVAVLGPSGCGKSTLLRAIAGLETPRSGRISWDGEDLAGVPTHRRGTALMFQDGQLFPGQSVARNVGYPMRLRRRPRKEIAGRVEELLRTVGLLDKADRLPEVLSGGERQRVALARALAVSPRLLLLDEPMSALDRDLREGLARQLRTILTESGTPAIMVTHDQEEAFAVADRIVLMRAGRIVQAGSLVEVWSAPVDAWAARFLGYPTVLEGAPARFVRDLGAPDAPWTEVALRRSALRADPGAPLRGVVVQVHAGPEVVRLRVEVAELGQVDAVADPGAVVRPGDPIGLGVDPSRIAPVGIGRRPPPASS